MLSTLLAPLLFLPLVQTPTPATATVAPESFIPASSTFIVRMSSIDTFAHDVGLFAPPGAGKDPIDLLKMGTSLDARWDLIDRSKPLLVAGSPSQDHPPVEMTIVASCKDAAAFAAAPALAKGGWTCTTSGNLIVLSSSKAGPVLAADSPLRAGLDRHDVVLRIAMEQVMEQYGEMIHAQLDQVTQLAEQAASTSDKPESVAAATTMLDGVSDALDAMESLEVHFSQVGDESRLGFAMTGQEGSSLAKVAKVDASHLPEAARAIEADAAFSFLCAVDFAKYMEWSRSMMASSLSALPEATRQQFTQMLDSMRSLYGDMGTTAALSLDVDGNGVRGLSFMRPKDPAAYMTQFMGLMKSGFPWLPISGPEKKQVDALDVATYHVKVDMDAMSKLIDPTKTIPPEASTKMNAVMAMLFGPNGMEMSTTQKNGALVIGFGSSTDLPKSVARMSATTPSAAGASLLQAMGTLNPGFVYRVDIGRLCGGIAEIAGKFATGENAGDLDELKALRVLPPIVLAAGVDGRTWKLDIAADGPKFVAAIEHIEAMPSPKKNTMRAKVDITSIESALKEYAMANAGKYPDSLEALIAPDENGYRFLNKKTVPLDPWGRPYLYTPPVPGTPEPRVYTLGADGKPGGTGENADIDAESIEKGR